MRIAVPRETAPGERRVALVPADVARLTRAGHAVVVERGAGDAAGFDRAAYEAAGAASTDDRAALWREAELALVVRRPEAADAARLQSGAALVGLVAPRADDGMLGALVGRGVTVLAMELVPRTTRAQSMDALSSQATIAGYKAVLLGAAELARILPMLTTAAGTLPPARAFVIGAGVAGLQAIATARRLGAVVSAFDVRPVVKEQVESLGARFVAAEAVTAEGAGGYARELEEGQQERVLQAIGRELGTADLVVTAAQIPGRQAPRLLTRTMLASMRPGSVVVDLAADSGGNCEATRAGETVHAAGVTVLGPTDLAASVPQHASQLYSRNLSHLIEYAAPDGRLSLPPDDPVTGPMRVPAGGAERGTHG